jgi:ribosomal protein L11 methyltransferase
MNRRFLWRLSVVTSDEAEEAVSVALADRLHQVPCTYKNLETGQTTVTVYLENRPDWSKAARNSLCQALRQFDTVRPQAASPKFRLTKLRTEDWAEAWKRHFKPLEIGARLLIKPSWSRRRAKAGQHEVVLDPGMSFGTGQHPTTSFCLKELARLRRPDQRQSFLDLGTGSGILAICAAKLGYSPVAALDLDPLSIDVARRNARLNQVSRQIRFQCQDVTKPAFQTGAQYSLICANLISTLLLAQKERLVALLQKEGLLVLAGVLKVEFAQVQAAYEARGLRLVNSRTEKEWRSGSFLR